MDSVKSSRESLKSELGDKGTILCYCCQYTIHFLDCYFLHWSQNIILFFSIIMADFPNFILIVLIYNKNKKNILVISVNNVLLRRRTNYFIMYYNFFSKIKPL
jgi:hypothetical protein